LSDQTKKHLLTVLRVDARATGRRPLEKPGPPKGQRFDEKNLFSATKKNKKYMLIALRVRARQERVRVDARATGRRPARQFILRARETSLANFEKVVGSESFLTTSQNKEKAGRFCLTVDNFPEPSQNKKKAGRFCLTVDNFPEPSRIQIRIRGKSCLCVGFTYRADEWVPSRVFVIPVP
jgi:hypothetical protein